MVQVTKLWYIVVVFLVVNFGVVALKDEVIRSVHLRGGELEKRTRWFRAVASSWVSLTLPAAIAFVPCHINDGSVKTPASIRTAGKQF